MIPPTRPEAAPHAPPGAPVSASDATLRDLLGRAGAVAMHRFGHALVRRKADGSVVTGADRAAEAVLSAGLRAAWPHDALVGEEGAQADGSGPGGARWVIDPIDGTSAFVEGLAHWGPTVARIDAGQVRIGAVWLPRLAEHYFFEEGLGAFFNGTAMPALDHESVSRRHLAFTPSRMHQVVQLQWPGRARNLGGHAAHLALVAGGAGQVALIGPGWSPWDTAAGLALIGAVGGVARRLPDGAPLHIDRDAGVPFVAGTVPAVAHLLRPDALRSWR